MAERLIGRLFLTLIAAVALSSTAAFAQSGRQMAAGAVERWEHDILDAARAPAITALGDNALRFSSQPALGGTGYVIVLRPDGRVRVSWFYGHAARGWRRTRWIAFRVSEREHRDLTEQIDALLDEAAPHLREMDEMDLIGVCADGPGYLTERVRNGEAHWYRPDCSGVNREIATRLTSWAFRNLGD